MLRRIHLLDIFIVLDIIEIVSRPGLSEQVLVGNELCSLIGVGLNVTCIILDVAFDPVLILNIKSSLVMNNPIIFVVLPILIIVLVSLLHFTRHVLRLQVGVLCDLIVELTLSFLTAGRLTSFLAQDLLLVSDDFRLSHALEIRILLAPVVIYSVVLFILRFTGKPLEHLGDYGLSHFRVPILIYDLLLRGLQSSLALLFLG